MARALDDRAVGPFACTGGETLFGYDFEIASATGLAVWRRRGGADEPLVVGVDYTVGGVGSPAGGDVTLIEPAIAGDLYIILGDTACARVTSLSSERALKAQALNREYDNLEFQIAELAAAQARALHRSPFDVTGGGVTLPPAVPGKLLGFDSDGNLDVFERGEGVAAALPDPLEVDDGGTGATNAADARANLQAVGYAELADAMVDKLPDVAEDARGALGLGALALRSVATTSDYADRSVTLAKMAAGMPGYILGYDAGTGLPEWQPGLDMMRVSKAGRHASGRGGLVRHWIVGGDVYVAGDGAERQNGTTADTTVPVRINFSHDPVLPIVSIVSGNGSTFVLDSAGRIYAMGANGSGQLGLGDTVDRHVATRIETFVGLGVSVEMVVPAPSYASGVAYTMFVGANGLLYAAGANANGQLGLGTTTAVTVPTLVPVLTNIAGAVASGGPNPHTLCWATSGQLYACGYNAQGQLGDGTTTQRTSFVALGITDCAEGYAAPYYSVVRRTGGGLAAAGSNSAGQLGQGDTVNRSAFTSITLAADVAQVALSETSVAVRLMSGAFQTWGGNANGQLGVGSTSNVTTPASPVGAFQGSTADVQAAAGVIYVRSTAGEVYAAGSGAQGAVGTGSTDASNSTFVNLIGRDAPIVDMAACGGATVGACGLTLVYDDGRSAVCGSNAQGELGHGTAGAHAFALTPVHLLNRRGPKGDVTPEAEAAALAAASSALAAQDAATVTTTQAGIATTQAGIATTQAGIATTQAGIATTQAGLVSGSVITAVAAAATAVTAAEASGDTRIFDTKAAATTALSGLPEGQIVEVSQDESRQGARTRYRVQSGALAYKITLGRSTLTDLKRGVYHLKRKSSPILIVATGQSNQLGSNNDLTGDNTTTDANVRVWNWSLGATGEWQTSTPGVYPPYGNSYPKTNNLVHWLGMRLYAETGRDVYIVLRAQGSQSIVEWTTGFVTTDQFGFLANEVTQALLTPDLADVTSDDIICLWGQGEQDAGMAVSTYRSHFYSVISRYKAESWWSNRTPFLCIELPHDTVYATQNALHSNHHRFGVANILTVSTEGLAVDSSGVHYTGEGLQEIGYNRCFDALMDYLSTPPPFDLSDPILAYPYPFASPADIRPGQPVDASNLRDLLLSSAAGAEHGIRSGNSSYSDLRGKTGYRTLVRGALADGASIPSDMPGGHLRLGGAATLPSTIPLGYTLQLQSVKTDGPCVVTAPSGVFGNDIDLTSGNIVIPLKGDSVTLVAYATDGSSWQVVEDNRRANVAGMINIPDDTAISIKAPYNCGKISITANPNASSPNIQMQALIGYDVGATINIGKWAGGSLVAAIAGDVSGTTGTDGVITVGGVSGYVRVENRTGGAIDLAWSWLM